MFSVMQARYQAFKSKYVVQERRKHEYAINRYYAHLVDPFLTKLAYDLKLSPNVVTILAGLAGVGTAVSFWYEQWIIGAILLQLHHLLDGADGNLARLKNQCTPFGAQLDRWIDQIVRLVLFLSIAYLADVSLWLKIFFLLTIYVDVAIIHIYVLPFSKKFSLIRSRWKEWFLARGIIPGVDIFTIFFLVSVCALFARLDILIYIVIIGKNIDWIYRVWECVRTKHSLKKKIEEG